ncbi:phenoloxidase-activating factor 3 isoform X1 [Drosophila hydei]|uniref:Phenoloxidase-activating factor 3 isoform X1 n=1 Tax=Drosophila hydei TaxID=7224 RepID=A0A6J1M171_DROHY|nr:phenoloxidase-activating factor 3 isoform X1 [Drosophila hydei]
MSALGNLIIMLILSVLNGNCAAEAETNCGKLEERLLYRKDIVTEPAEYPWIGLLFQRKGQKFRNAGCNVVIVGESHVLTTASCVQGLNTQPGSIAVRLGIWDETHQPGEPYICNDKGFCVPGPVQYLVDAITVHPLADKDTGINDIAILQLSQRINMTTYIQPVCLQPTLEPASWTSMDFHYGGFEEADVRKVKDMAITISRQVCTTETATPPPDNQFCGLPRIRASTYKGAPLMGINVENDVPRSFYLVGILVRTKDVGQVFLFFQDIKPLRRWIMDNTHSASS